MAKDETSDGHVLVWLIKRKAISRQYHTWFDWTAANANRFFQMFGEGFRDQASEWVKADQGLVDSVRDFLEIGRERNRLIHEDFANAPMEKTAAEVYEMWNSARMFVEWFPKAIRRHLHK